MKRTLNEIIKLLRTQRGLNQVEFAKQICVTKQCVSNWENDNVVPSIEMLERLADFFGVTTDFLLGRSTQLNICADGLTETQVAHLQMLVDDFRKANQS